MKLAGKIECSVGKLVRNLWKYQPR